MAENQGIKRAPGAIVGQCRPAAKRPNRDPTQGHLSGGTADVRPHPFGEGVTFQTALSQTEQDFFLFVDGRDEFQTVEKQKRLHRGVADPLVAIDKGMITDEREPDRRCLLDQSRIEFPAIEGHPRLSYR